MDCRPIGIFDSGVGGLSVVKEVFKILSDEQIIYFGDTKRAPYGTRKKEQIVEFTNQMIEFLLKNNCKILVIACNTICIACLDNLTMCTPIIEVITPSIIEACKANKEVGILGTDFTIRSNKHKDLIKQINPNINLTGVACPLFVNLVEDGLANTDLAYNIAIDYCKAFADKNIEMLILGCTHFPLISDQIQKAIGYDVKLIDPAKGTALKLKTYLEHNDMLNDSGKKPNHKFYCTGDLDKFNKSIELFLGKQVDGFVYESENKLL